VHLNKVEVLNIADKYLASG